MHQIYLGTANLPAVGLTLLQNLMNSCTAATTITAGRNGEIRINEYFGEGGRYSHIMTPNIKSCYF